MYSATYAQHLLQGPFPHRIDPWGEDDHYFQQLHSGLIAALVDQLASLALRGYVIGTGEFLTSPPGPLSIKEHGEGELPHVTWDIQSPWMGYFSEVVDKTASLEATHLEALWIRDGETGDLITIVEILSPGNKTLRGIADYADDRHEYLSSGVNFVEIDPTRSSRRATDHNLTRLYAYHLAVYLPEAGLRIIGMAFDQPLKRFALPLKGEVIGVDLALAYREAYQKRQIAAQMALDHHYTLARLPFPTLISDTEIQNVDHDD